MVMSLVSFGNQLYKVFRVNPKVEGVVAQRTARSNDQTHQ